MLDLALKKSIIICDHNTARYCLPLLNVEVNNSFIITIPAGEESKSLLQVSNIVQQLIDNNVDRNATIINLGGGVVSDVGGFVASVYKRGVDYINIPTSLLAMVDASIGGKTGIDFAGVKNVVGAFTIPQNVITHHEFLNTLPEEEFLSGFAEMLKYGLIADMELFEMLIKKGYRGVSINDITRCQNLKQHFVNIDPFDKCERKALNFGHTFGHAFESLSIEQKRTITHGHAVAMGLLCELYLSRQLLNYPYHILEVYRYYIQNVYSQFKIQIEDFDPILHFMMNDKKNDNGVINCVLLDSHRMPLIDYPLTKEYIFGALDYFIRL